MLNLAADTGVPWTEARPFLLASDCAASFLALSHIPDDNVCVHVIDALEQCGTHDIRDQCVGYCLHTLFFHGGVDHERALRALSAALPRVSERAMLFCSHALFTIQCSEFHNCIDSASCCPLLLPHLQNQGPALALCALCDASQDHRAQLVTLGIGARLEHAFAKGKNVATLCRLVLSICVESSTLVLLQRLRPLILAAFEESASNNPLLAQYAPLALSQWGGCEARKAGEMGLCFHQEDRNVQIASWAALMSGGAKPLAPYYLDKILTFLERDDPKILADKMVALEAQLPEEEKVDIGDLGGYFNLLQQFQDTKQEYLRLRSLEHRRECASKSVQEEYKERLLPFAKKKFPESYEIAVDKMIRNNLGKEHEFYVRTCKQHGKKPLPRYTKKADTKAFDTPRLSAASDTARRLEDLYAVTKMSSRLKCIPRNLRLWRGNEHAFYVKECDELGMHPLPQGQYQEMPQRPCLLIDDEEVQYIGQTCLSILIPAEFFPELEERLCQIIERSLGHPLGRIDIAAQGLKRVMVEPETRQLRVVNEEKKAVKRAKWAKKLMAFYGRHNPNKTMNDVHKLLTEYEGQEAELYQKMHEAYQLDASEGSDCEST